MATNGLSYSAGLEYAWVDKQNNTCAVTGLGTCTDTELHIPPVSVDWATSKTAKVVGVYEGNNTPLRAGAITAAYIPPTVTYIGSSAFNGCKSLEKVIIPNSVTQIGATAFQNCTALKEVTIGTGIQEIASTAFLQCIHTQLSVHIARPMNVVKTEKLGTNWYTDLTSTSTMINIHYTEAYGSKGLSYEKLDDGTYAVVGVTAEFKDRHIVVPAEVPGLGKVTSISEYALSSDVVEPCAITVQKGIKVIHSNAFADNNKLAYVELPSSASVSQNVCAGCTKLVGIEVHQLPLGEDGYRSLSAFTYDSPLLTTVRLSGTDVGENAFINQTSLLHVEIPNAASIGIRAFRGTSITTLDIPQGCSSIGEYAFSNCSYLQEIKLPEGLTTLASRLFKESGQLKFVSIPSTVTTLGGYVFDDCSLTSVSFSNQLRTIHKDAFSSSNLGTITINRTVDAIEGAPWGASDNTTINWTGTVSEDLAFTHDPDLKGYVVSAGQCTEANIIIPATYQGVPVKAVGAQGFEGHARMRSVIVPENVEKLRYSCFERCDLLKEIDLPSSLTTVENDVLMTSMNDDNIQIELDVVRYASTINSWVGISFAEDYNPFFTPNTRFIVQDEEPTSLILSAESVGYNAFTGLSQITNVEFTDTVETIRSDAFRECKNLKTVQFGANVVNIEINAFNQCPLETIVFEGSRDNPPALESVGGHAFNTAQTTAREVTYKGTIESWLGINFEDASANPLYRNDAENTQTASVLIFPNSWTQEPETVLDVTIPTSTTQINDYAFYGCTSIQSVSIPVAVKTIGENTFTGCLNLATIELEHDLDEVLGKPWGAKPTTHIIWLGALQTNDAVEFYNLQDADYPNRTSGAISFGVKPITNAEGTVVSTGENGINYDGVLYVTSEGAHAVGTFDADKIRFTEALKFNQNFGRFKPNGTLTEYPETKGMSIQEFIQSAFTDYSLVKEPSVTVELIPEFERISSVISPFKANITLQQGQYSTGKSTDCHITHVEFTGTSGSTQMDVDDDTGSLDGYSIRDLSADGEMITVKVTYSADTSKAEAGEPEYAIPGGVIETQVTLRACNGVFVLFSDSEFNVDEDLDDRDYLLDHGEVLETIPESVTVTNEWKYLYILIPADAGITALNAVDSNGYTLNARKEDDGDFRVHLGNKATQTSDYIMYRAFCIANSAAYQPTTITFNWEEH